MRLAAIILVRNEIDILPAFLSHLAALFDIVLIMDHGSVDGTEKMGRHAAIGRPGWHVWHVAVPGIHQAAFSTFAMRHLFATTDADAVLFLDADEFLDVPNRASLEKSIASLRDPRSVGTFAWLNCVPDSIDAKSHHLDDMIWIAPKPSSHRKVLITRALFDATGGLACPTTGNHAVEPGDGRAITEQPLGHILHLPLRSVAQMERKILTGTLSALARSDRPSREFSHWLDAVGRMADGAVGEAELVGMAYNYGFPPEPEAPRRIADLASFGFHRRTMQNVASMPIDLPDVTGPSNSNVYLAAVLRDWRQMPSAGLDLVLDGDELRCSQTPMPPEALPEPVGSSVPSGTEWERILAERDAARHEVTLLRASTSYRVTAPLRALARIFRT